MSILKPVLFLLLFLVMPGCQNTGSGDSDASHFDIGSAEKARNIILFIGDGMGAEQRKAARWASVGQNGRLFMDDMPVTGSIETRSADNAITDSAAAGTAYAAGVNTKNGVIGMDANLKSVTTILERARRRGMLAGLVTTTQITHATPAVFAAHVPNRNSMTEIAEQMLATGVQVLLGGGEDEFLPPSTAGCYPETGKRTDGKNLIREAVASGYDYICDASAFRKIDVSSTTQLLGLFADEGMQRPYSPSLADMTQTAIDILSKDADGFFLMVEGGQIDWACHGNNAKNAILDTLGLDAAVAVAKRFAAKTMDTLIIVTADHETGGMIISLLSSGLVNEDGPFVLPEGGQFYVNWSTDYHTGVNVPVTAQGPGSGMLAGEHDNTFVHEVMLRAMGEP